jgi:hypothetical protein
MADNHEETFGSRPVSTEAKVFFLFAFMTLSGFIQLFLDLNNGTVLFFVVQLLGTLVSGWLYVRRVRRDYASGKLGAEIVESISEE